ncbi:MAG: SlyX family protein [Arenicella sp.]
MPNSKRIDNLEMKIAFLEDAIEQLSDEFFTQQKHVALLQSQNLKMLKQIEELNSNDEGSVIDESPPHY